MELTELKNKIKTNKVPNFLIFTGDEWEVQKIYIQQIAKDKAYSRIDSITDILGKLNTKSLTGKKRTVYVMRDDKVLMSNEKLWGKLEKLLGDNILIFLITKPDKRTKFYNKYKSAFIEFKPLNEANLKTYIKKEIDLNDKNCQSLIDICESNYGRILLEIDKIKHFEARPNLYPNSIFELLVKEGTIYQARIL